MPSSPSPSTDPFEPIRAESFKQCGNCKQLFREQHGAFAQHYLHCSKAEAYIDGTGVPHFPCRHDNCTYGGEHGFSTVNERNKHWANAHDRKSPKEAPSQYSLAQCDSTACTWCYQSFPKAGGSCAPAHTNEECRRGPRPVWITETRPNLKRKLIKIAEGIFIKNWPCPFCDNNKIETLAGRNRHMGKAHPGQVYPPSESVLNVPDPRQSRRRVSSSSSPHASAPKASHGRNKQPASNAGQERSASRGRLHDRPTASLARISSSAPPPRSKSAASLPDAPSLSSRSVSAHSEWSYESPSPSPGPSRPRGRTRPGALSDWPGPRSASSSSVPNRHDRAFTPLFQTDTLQQALQAAGATRCGGSPSTAVVPAAKRPRRLSTPPEMAAVAKSLTARGERARGRNEKR